MNPSLNRIWLAVMVGLLAATSNNWLFAPTKTSNYDAPWIYPGLVQKDIK